MACSKLRYLAHPPHIVHERVEVVGLGDSDLEGEVSGDVAGQTRQALLPRSPHPDKKHVPTRHAQDSGHRDEVSERIVE